MSGEPRARVRIESLRIYGFGPFRGAVEAAFPDGLGVLALPNERGKSTLAHALAALLFGLPHSSDRSVFGTARFRNHRHPARFEGEIVLSAGGRRYRLARNFDNHRITLAEADEGAWREIAVGEHNPGARRPNARYASWLSEVFGHASRELFEATFFVGQPMPLPHQLDAQIQSLLAGGRGSGGRAALEHLAAAAKELTRFTGARGLSARDGRKDGRIEALEAEIAELKAEIARSAAALSEAHDVAGRLAACDGEIADLGLRRARVDQELEAAQAWLALARSAMERSEEAARLATALREVRRCEDELKRVELRLAAEYPEFSAEGDRIGDALLAVRELFQAARELERLRRERDEIDEERRRKEAERSSIVDWDLGGGDASGWVRAFREAAERAREEWPRFEAFRRRIDEVRRERTGTYAAFEEAAPALIEAAASYPERRRELVRDLEAADRAVAEAKARIESLSAERRSVDVRFARVAGRARFLEEVEELAKVREERERIQAALSRSDALWRGLARARAFAGAAAALLVLAWALRAVDLEIAGLVPAFVLIAFAVAGGMVPPFVRTGRARKERRAALRTLLERERSLAEGPLSWIGRGELGEVRAELAAYREALDALARHEEREGERLREAEEAAAACRRRLEELEEALAGPHGDPSAFHQAYQAWQELAVEERRLRQAASELLVRWGAPEVGSGEESAETGRRAPDRRRSGLLEAARGLDPELLHEPWPTLARSLRSVAKSETWAGRIAAPSSLEGAALALDALDDAFWREIERRAGECDRLGREILELELRREAIDRSELPRRRRSAVELVDRLERTFPGDWRNIREWIDDPAAAGAGTLAQRIPPPLSHVLRVAGGSVEAARKRFDAWKALAEEESRLRAALRSTLAAWGAESVVELEGRHVTAGARLQQAIGRLEGLAGKNPALPDRPGGDIERVQRRVEQLREEKGAVERRIGELEAESLELRRRKAELEGERPVNVAEAEDRLGALVQERDRLLFELDAVACAFAQLEQAAQEYYGDHVGRLARAASERFASLCGRPGRRVTLSEALEVGVVEPDGTRVAVRQLSQGAQDLLFLSLRLAIADLVSAGKAVPFVFDDPFLNLDAARAERMRECLARLARERQVIVLTHQEELLSWGEPVEMEMEGVEG